MSGWARIIKTHPSIVAHMKEIILIKFQIDLTLCSVHYNNMLKLRSKGNIYKLKQKPMRYISEVMWPVQQNGNKAIKINCWTIN